MLRIATLDDYELVLSMVNKFINAAELTGETDEETVRYLVRGVLEDPNAVTILWENSAFISGRVTPYVFGLQTVAAELGWWVDPEIRGTNVGKELIEAFEYWAAKRGCSLVTMVSLDDDLGKYYEKRGYRLAERTYMKELN